MTVEVLEVGVRWARATRRFCAAISVAILLALGGVPLASAHDVVLHSSPPDGGTVSEFPRLIELEFSGVPQPQFNTVAVTDATTGTLLFRGTPQLDQQFVRLAVPEGIHPGQGNYVVGFQITSSDGHATRGKTTFQVAGTEGSREAPSSDVPPGHANPVDSTDKTPGMPIVAVGLIVIIVVGGGIAMAARKRRGAKDTTHS